VAKNINNNNTPYLWVYRHDVVRVVWVWRILSPWIHWDAKEQEEWYHLYMLLLVSY
jgi:hypothetical protein